MPFSDCLLRRLVHLSTFAQSVQLVARVPARQLVAARARPVPRRAVAARPVAALETAATTVAGAGLVPVRPVVTTATTTASTPRTCGSSAGTAPTRPTALPALWLVTPALRTAAPPAPALAASAGDSRGPRLAVQLDAGWQAQVRAHPQKWASCDDGSVVLDRNQMRFPIT